MTLIRARRAGAACLALLLANAATAAAQDHLVEDLGALPGGSLSIATAIDENGRVAGFGDQGNIRALVWEGGPPRDLGALPGGICGPGATDNCSFAFGIDDADRVVGHSGGAAGLSRPVAWGPAGIGDLGTLPGGAFGQAFAIAPGGDIVGFSADATGVRRATLWRGGTAHDLGGLAGGGPSEARAIGAAGVAVGFARTGTGETRAVIFEAGGSRDLGTLPGGRGSEAHGVDSAGAVVGWSEGSDGLARAVLWSGGATIDLGVLPGGGESRAYALSDAGFACGEGTAADGLGRALLWDVRDPGAPRLIDLGTLPGGLSSRATAINELGQVAGAAETADGFTHAVVWSPVAVVTIDVRPRDGANVVRLGSGGNVAVAIVSDPGFAATDVNPATVTFAGAPVKRRPNGTPVAATDDVDHDGRLDLVLHFETAALALSAGDIEAVLEGFTFRHRAIRGRDTVRVRD